MDKKIVHPKSRDPMRNFTGGLLKKLMVEAGGFCSHPFCDSPYLSLNAHHIFHHARGGLTIRPNGLILCKKCHRSLHEGFIPQRLVLLIKYWISSERLGHLFFNNFSADELVDIAEQIKIDRNIAPNQKFNELNDILIAANFFPVESIRYFVFVNAIAAKVTILNDGTSTLRSSLNGMLVSMDHRRKWAQILAANAFKYAKEIKHNWLALYFIHSRAVGFNARNKFGVAVNEFSKALAFLESMQIAKEMRSEAIQVKSRLIRERAVCRAKETSRSVKAKAEVIMSLDIANSIGEIHNIHDALVRCVEGFIYLGELSKAEAYLDRLYLNWSDLDDHLKAITMKMDAKLSILQNKMKIAEEIIGKGLDWSKEHGFHHQTYHFKRLSWHLNLDFEDKRQRIIT